MTTTEKTFTITCQHGKFASRWVVRAYWLGAERVVYESPSVYACCRWVAKQKED
jgi:hypothetical protein